MNAVVCAYLVACSAGAKGTPVSPDVPTSLPEAAYSVTMFEPLAGDERSSVSAVNNAGVFASGLNDAGDAIGSAGNDAYLWPNSGPAIVVSPLCPVAIAAV